MCHETNQRCAGQVQHLQNVSLAVELRRWITEKRTSMEPRDYATAYFAIMLADFQKRLDELAPDYSQCDNPPE